MNNVPLVPINKGKKPLQKKRTTEMGLCGGGRGRLGYGLLVYHEWSLMKDEAKGQGPAFFL